MQHLNIQTWRTYFQKNTSLPKCQYFWFRTGENGERHVHVVVCHHVMTNVAISGWQKRGKSCKRGNTDSSSVEGKRFHVSRRLKYVFFRTSCGNRACWCHRGEFGWNMDVSASVFVADGNQTVVLLQVSRVHERDREDEDRRPPVRISTIHISATYRKPQAAQTTEA